MGYKVRKDTLSKKQTTDLYKLLNVKPKLNQFIIKNYRQNIPGLNFFYQTSEEPGFLNIPFKIAEGYLGVNPNQDNNHRPVKGTFKGTLFDYQKPIIEKCMQILNDTNTLILQAYTGFGKTVANTYIHTHLPNKTLAIVLVYIKGHAKQWRKAYETNTNMKVLVIDDDLVKKPLKVEMFKDVEVIITLYTRVTKIPTVVLDEIGELFIDEGHLFCTENKVPNILAIHPKRIIINTATVERERDHMERVLYMLAGMDNLVSCDIEKDFQVYKVITGLEVPDFRNKKGHKDFGQRHNWISDNDEFNMKIVMALYTICQDVGAKVLVTCGRVEHARRLNELFESYCNDRKVIVEKERNKLWRELRREAADYLKENKGIEEWISEEWNNMETGKKTKFRWTDEELSCLKEDYDISHDWLAGKKDEHINARVLFGNCQKIGTGYDVANFCDEFDGINYNVWFCLFSFATESVIYQNAGRVIFRTKDPIVYYVCYTDSMLKKHEKLAEKWFIKKGATVSSIKLDNMTWEDISEYY